MVRDDKMFKTRWRGDGMIGAWFVNAMPRLIVDVPDAAIEFYHRALGARLSASYVLDGVLVHAVLEVGDAVFTLAAEVAERGFLSPWSVGGSSVLCPTRRIEQRSTT